MTERSNDKSFLTPERSIRIFTALAESADSFHCYKCMLLAGWLVEIDLEIANCVNIDRRKLLVDRQRTLYNVMICKWVGDE